MGAKPKAGRAPPTYGMYRYIILSGSKHPAQGCLYLYLSCCRRKERAGAASLSVSFSSAANHWSTARRSLGAWSEGEKVHQHGKGGSKSRHWIAVLLHLFAKQLLCKEATFVATSISFSTKAGVRGAFVALGNPQFALRGVPSLQ